MRKLKNFLGTFFLSILFIACNQAEVLSEKAEPRHSALSYKQTRDIDVYVADGVFGPDPITYDGPISKEVEDDICVGDESICFVIVSVGAVVSAGDTVDVKMNGSSGYVTREGIVNTWNEDAAGNVSDYDITLF